MTQGFRVFPWASLALALLLLLLGSNGEARAQDGQMFTSVHQEYSLRLAKGWKGWDGEAAKTEAKAYFKVLPGLEKSLNKLSALLVGGPKSGCAVYFASYPASARAQGVASFWNKYVAFLRNSDAKYGHSDLKHEQGYSGRTPYFRQIGPEPGPGLFIYSSRYRRWDGVITFKFFCPWGQENEWLDQFRQMADSIEFVEGKVKSKSRGF